jgi:nucleotide-binding universal stress UspA family protein
MFQRILVPVDGSEPSNAAIQLGLHLAKEHKGQVIFVHAVELNKIVAMAGPAPIDPSMAVEASCSAGKIILDDAKREADQAGVECTCEQPEDDCVNSVLAIAKHLRADLIVIGSHGRTGVSRLVLGSVAEGILRRSPIPVLVCHAPHLDARHSVTRHLADVAEQSVI